MVVIEMMGGCDLQGSDAQHGALMPSKGLVWGSGNPCRAPAADADPDTGGEADVRAPTPDAGFQCPPRGRAAEPRYPRRDRHRRRQRGGCPGSPGDGRGNGAGERRHDRKTGVRGGGGNPLPSCR